MNEPQQWYVTIAGNAVGPVSTDLVLRGIKHRKIATEAYVCVVGAQEWQALADVPEFHGALKENGLLPEIGRDPSSQTEGAISLASIAAAQAQANQTSVATQSSDVTDATPESLTDAVEDDESELTAPFSSRGVENAPPLAAQAAADAVEETTALLPSRPAPQVAIYEAASPASGATPATAKTAAASESPANEPRNGKHVQVAFLSHPPMPSIDIEVDIAMDDHEHPAPEIDWNRGFADYFLVNSNVTLPDDQLLLRSLTKTPHETFLHDEAMWNLALCLAFGSNAVASVAADVFFDVVTAHGQYERIEWVARTLLSRGFMPSGIPHANGNQAIGRLRQACPDELRVRLESQIGA